MNWFSDWIHRMFGSDPRYHQQANEVTIRQIRVERLNRELAIYRRGKYRMDSELAAHEAKHQ